MPESEKNAVKREVDGDIKWTLGTVLKGLEKRLGKRKIKGIMDAISISVHLISSRI